MSEIQECSSVGSVSVDNTINNNEKDQSKIISSLQDAKNEILHTVDKDAVKVQEDIPKLNENLNIENENTISNASNITKNDLILKSMSDTVTVKDEFNKVSKSENALICKLEEEVKERIIERDMYHRKLVEVEQKLTDLEAFVANTIKSVDNNKESVAHVTLTELKNKLTETIMQLEDRGVIMANQEKQINALNIQVSTLKEVVAITRDLLQIRNKEVKHLQAEVDNMEARIAEEREKHNTMMSRMDDAVRLNSDLKKEYETQLNLFKDLRIKYDEKITLLSEEKRALELSNQPAAN
ncbi:PREDICTED: filamin A-interacting protein 1-like [Polistes canadensis]|uniref:filamin A-interacting protein 1-like n=1 Tax=Polistes canadensis TaxID=91411 RepID=UPI000718DC68|nr:PREDICTED: filamin A-interacting protein 1-like [Polistes canadensis]XP_014615300.1 PREDICTED: filamin A-interacting protein 1-like [Polistes canadensis]